jgi:hypothetical protein
VGTEGKGGQSVMLTTRLIPVPKINKASFNSSVLESACYCITELRTVVASGGTVQVRGREAALQSNRNAF